MLFAMAISRCRTPYFWAIMLSDSPDFTVCFIPLPEDFGVAAAADFPLADSAAGTGADERPSDTPGIISFCPGCSAALLFRLLAKASS